MRKITILLLISLCFQIAKAQQKFEYNVEIIKGKEIICPASTEYKPSFVDMPLSVKNGILAKQKAIANKSIKTNNGVTKATIVVNYVGFTADAKNAFQRAIDIWSELLNSEVTINVNAYWEPLGENVLGSAGSNGYLKNSPGVIKSNTYFPIVLAEKMAGADLNSPNTHDIIARFSSETNWNYSTGSVSNGYYDLTTVVLHELGHGLGFVSSAGVEGTEGNYGLRGTYDTKLIFDEYIQNADSKNLVDTTVYTNPSEAIKALYTSNQVYFVSPNTNTTSKVKLYANKSWDDGSSISHLDENTYNTGTENSLMTPFLRSGEMIYNPGPIVLKMFADMGWKSSSIIHEPLNDFTSTNNVTFKAKIISDTTLIAGSAKLNYVLMVNNRVQSPVSVPLAYNVSTKEYYYDLAIPAGTNTVYYYFQVNDAFGKNATSPPDGGFTKSNYAYSFDIGGKDSVSPTIKSAPIESIQITDPLNFVAIVKDNFENSIDSVYISYSLNSSNVITKKLLKKYVPGTDPVSISLGYDNNFLYFVQNPIAGLKVGDVVKYQFVAVDKSQNKIVYPTTYGGTSPNQKDKPVATYNEFVVLDNFESMKANATANYGTNFDNSSSDFNMVGFSISTPEGFIGKSLNSSHPYSNGNGMLSPTTGGILQEFEKNEIAYLRKPILLSKDTSMIRFDEVVLVEPGDSGSVYGGSSFFDYVVIEGSVNGKFWFPLQDGYDSRINSTWNSLFLKNMSGGTAPNSTSVANLTMYKERATSAYGLNVTADMAGTPLFLRFRLYSDQWTTGWGWNIDNLYIQKQKEIILANEPTNSKGISLFPNPTAQHVNINLEISEPQTVKTEVFSMLGQNYYTNYMPVANKSFQHQINVGNMPNGTYFVKVTEKAGIVVKRFVIER